jgi:hypothetical protein
MSVEDREVLEAEIETALLEQWDPLGKRSDTSRYGGYREYAHEVYNLLARGASDTQVARRLHEAEAAELGHPELRERDLSDLMRVLRKIESKI